MVGLISSARFLDRGKGRFRSNTVYCRKAFSPSLSTGYFATKASFGVGENLIPILEEEKDRRED